MTSAPEGRSLTVAAPISGTESERESHQELGLVLIAV